MSKINEHELIQQCLAGNPVAQKTLYDTYARTMYGLCIRYSSNTEEAQDILQDGFVKVFAKLGQFSFNGSFEGWMKRIFMNNLAPGYRTVLNLFVIEGFSHAEIAEMLGISEGTSKSQLNRARAQLYIALTTYLKKEK